jgi:two-component system, LytTR family, sensor kinase
MILKGKKRGLLILLAVMFSYAIFLNYLIFGYALFSEISFFTITGFVTTTVISAFWNVHAWITHVLKERFSKEKDYPRRIGFTLVFLLLIKSMVLTLLTIFYNDFLGYEFDDGRYARLLAVGAVVNVFVIFFREGARGFNKWKGTLVETEKLKKEYMKSQLWGLQSQVNPHLLFNNLNSLSSLIQEDTDEAEAYLGEMCMVYRYILRSGDNQLISLHDEVAFLKSYFYLLNQRHGSGLKISIDVSEEQKEFLLPPLTLQMIVENVMNTNRIEKTSPLCISIKSSDENWLIITSNIQPKFNNETEATDGLLKNIGNKFVLLGSRKILINNVGTQRIISLPLFVENERVLA